jgi:hypothetical protein
MTEHQEVLIRYNIPEIYACRDANTILSKELEEYCYHKHKNPKSMIESELMKEVNEITNSLSQGINPNDITLKSMIRDNLNKISHSNYKDILAVLKSLNYSSENHFFLLATELIIKSMNDIMACKGLESTKNQLTPSEIYVNIAVEFSKFFIEEGNEIIKFQVVLGTTCQKYFKEFVDKEMSMDQNNPHRVSNYKGFMNMIGLLFYNNLFPLSIILKCFTRISNLILNSDLSQEECDNYYAGYERLLNQILNKYEDMLPKVDKNSDQYKVDKTEFLTIYKFMKTMNAEISASTTDKPKGSIRKFSLMVHQQNINRLENLFNSFNK